MNRRHTLAKAHAAEIYPTRITEYLLGYVDILSLIYSSREEHHAENYHHQRRDASQNRIDRLPSSLKTPKTKRRC